MITINPIDWSKVVKETQASAKILKHSESAPNKTANNTEMIVTILERLEASNISEANKNRRRFIITSSIAGIAALAAIISLFF